MGTYFATSTGISDCYTVYDSTTTYGIYNINPGMIRGATFRGEPIEIIEEKREITYEEFLNL